MPYLSATQEAELCLWLEARLCRDSKETRAHIGVDFGVQYSPSGGLKLRHRLGFEYKKPKALALC